MRQKLARWRTLGARERWVLLQAALLLPVAWLALKTLGLQRVLRVAREVAGITAQGPDPDSDLAPARLGDLVAMAAGNHVWSFTCLTRSLLLLWMLGRRGVRGELRIGVRKAGDAIQSHAWVECGGAPVNDASGEFERYAVLAVLPSREPQGLR